MENDHAYLDLVPAPDRPPEPPPSATTLPTSSFRPRLEALEDRLTPSGGGLLDPTFGSGGIVHLPSTTDNYASAVAVQPDGKVVVAGQITTKGGNDAITVQRLNPNGSLDTTFNRTGSLTITTGQADYPSSVALQPDGKILVGGYAKSSNGADEFLIARINGTTGTLDSTFASKGLWVYASPLGVVEGLAVLTDPANPNSVTGIVAAARGSVNGTPCFEAIELSPAGKLDSSFGSGGLAVFANLSGGQVRSVAAAPSGEIYLAGYVQFGSMTVPDGCVAAITPAGALDTAFGGGAGYVLADPTGSHDIEFNDVAVQNLTVNGQAVSRVVVAGLDDPPATHFSGVVYGYTSTGALDASFGSGGTFSIPGLGTGYDLDLTSLALEADGSIVGGGYQYYATAASGTGEEMLVGHLTANGTADASFGPDGTGFNILQDGLISKVQGVAIDPTDGEILTAGYTTARTGPSQASVARWTAP